MHTGNSDLLSFLVLLSGSLFMPVLAERFRVPGAILLILFGLAVDPHAAGLVQDDAVVGFLSEIGFVLLMFMAGVEIDFEEMRQRGRLQFLVIVAINLMAFGLAFCFAGWLGLKAIFGLALGAVSVGVPLAVLAESGALWSRLGHAVVLVGSVGEFFTVIGITVFYLSARHGLSVNLLFDLLELLAVLAVAAFSLKTLTAIAWWWPERVLRLGRLHGTSEIGLRAALFLMMSLSMMALLAGVEAIVGAFVAGAFISYSFRGKQALEAKLAVVGHGLFIPIFFIAVGLRFDPSVASRASVQLAAVLLLVAGIVKVIPGAVLLGTGLSFRESMRASFLLSAPLTLVVAIAALGLELSEGQAAPTVIDEAGANSLVLMAVASGIVYPVLFKVLRKSGSAAVVRGPGQ